MLRHEKNQKASVTHVLSISRKAEAQLRSGNAKFQEEWGG